MKNGNGASHLLLGLIQESTDLCDALAERIVADGDRAAIKRIISSHIQTDPEKVWNLLLQRGGVPEGKLPEASQSNGNGANKTLNGQTESYKKRIVTFLRKNPGAARGEIVSAVSLGEFGPSAWDTLRAELLDEKRIRRKGQRGHTRYWAR